jgi:flagellin FlaB
MIRDALTDDRGQVGIGTLIVFIALVLVAAIAAGVLINTAGFLQTQAEQTGEDSSSQVANNINVIGEVGVVNGSDGTNDPPAIEMVRLTVQRSPGSDNVDLSELSIQYVGDNGFANYIYVGEGGDNEYAVEAVTAASDGDTVMTDDADRYQILIPFIDNSSTPGNFEEASVNDVNGDDNVSVSADINGELLTGQQAEIQITTADRATRNAFIQVPDTIESDQNEVTL